MSNQPANTKSHPTQLGETTLFPEDLDLEDDLPIVLQVLEGVEVEEMPDIHVEREPAIYEPNRLGELKRILEAAEKKAAEMESAGGYRPWRTNLPAGTTQQNHLVSIRPVDKDQLDEEPRVEVSVENRTAFMPESLGGAGTVIGRNHKSRLLGMSLFSKRPKTTPTPCPKKRGQDEG